MDPLTRLALDATVDVAMPRYARIVRRRAQLEEEIAAVFGDVDVLLTPATAVPAFAATGPMPAEIAGQKVHPAMVVPFTMAANLCWNPAVSVPAGPTQAGLPVGLQVMGRRHADAAVLRLARIYEQVRPWPPVAPRPFARSS
jgi:aspartyl-tRNA(Asn)/glutamyl-tRNA(Gln) amidotransferase subunit A